jgi:hypothetical protein
MASSSVALESDESNTSTEWELEGSVMPERSCSSRGAINETPKMLRLGDLLSGSEAETTPVFQ